MQSFLYFIDSKLPFTSVAIGKFDGMHLAHLRLLDMLCGQDDSLGKDFLAGDSSDSCKNPPQDNTQKHNLVCVLTITSTKPPFITPPREREKYSKIPFFRLRFEHIKTWESIDFLKLLFKVMPRLRRIIVGYDFCFGRGRSSSASDIRDMLDSINKHYVELKVMESVTFNGTPIHTSIIKELLKYGDIPSANAMLGRFYSIKGRIIKGQGLGKKSLYPTINIKNSLNIIPKFGVYASFMRLGVSQNVSQDFFQGLSGDSEIKSVFCKNLLRDFLKNAFCEDVSHENRLYKAVSFVGNRLSTDSSFCIETHILDCESIATNESFATIFFVEMIRNNKKFTDLNALKEQIRQDIESSRKILDRYLSARDEDYAI